MLESNTNIPQDIIDEYGLAGKADANGWIYFEIRRACYGLPQAGILANTQLRERLEAAGYYEAATAPGLWRHNVRPIQFCVIVDGFGVEYKGIEHFNHLLTTLQKFHTVTCNMKGDKIAGINLQ